MVIVDSICVWLWDSSVCEQLHGSSLNDWDMYSKRNGICSLRGRTILAMRLILVALGDTVVLIVDGIRRDKGFEFESNGICSRRGRVIAEIGLILVVLGASW